MRWMIYLHPAAVAICTCFLAQFAALMPGVQ